GAHTFAVRAEANGVADPTPATRAWTITTPSPSGAPANDNFANATQLADAGGNLTTTNVDATRESGEPNHAGVPGGRSVWFTWTAQASGSVTVDTVGSAFDTMLAAYTGDAVSALTTAVANDDAGGARTSSITFAATAGVTYRFQVDGYRHTSTGVV